jgi:hypothetical protein
MYKSGERNMIRRSTCQIYGVFLGLLAVFAYAVLYHFVVRLWRSKAELKSRTVSR